MGQEPLQIPHKLTLHDRKNLTMNGVTEIVSFDDEVIILKTSLGRLVVQGQQLQLKNLSLDGGQVAVDGKICALTYEELRQGGRLRHLFK